MRNYKRDMSVDSDADMSGDECNFTFQDSVYLAEQEDRLIKGLFEAARVLEMCPDIVETCILPSGKSQDISTHIQHKLIEAYCWENDIQIVELDHAEFQHTIKVQRNKSMDLSTIECVLITSKPVEDELDGTCTEMDENFG
ncbi:growth arrest and DNA damage-inducible protein GADD45 gamma-like [Ruditapes philippinarum]|uniref:growth arrest and DNA damage-inducible protein GADD45 gamma-like n=1 Tax=Ruditapes philippinarum TaxID=129788 RepID=UPI00295B51C8|nr:growth arrest and DNA damage-inducible protein GADD45 gamma-like [Ruditapes philippinarum]